MAVLSDLVYASLRVAGVVHRARRRPPIEIQNEVLEIFNRMVGTWSNVTLMIFEELITPITLTAGLQTTTIGPGGHFNFDRPNRLRRANLIIFQGPPETRRPIKVLEPAEWAAKRVQQVSGPPLQVYDDYASPLSTLYWWPIPDQNYPAELFTPLRIATATSLANLIQYPDGYEEAIVHNLALRIAAAFPEQASVNADARRIARESLNAIQSRNVQSPRQVNDASRLGRGSRGARADFNWLDGMPL